MQQSQEREGGRPHHARRGVAERATAVLQRARLADQRTPRAMLPADIRHEILELCMQAHAERMPVERLIVLLKEGWSSLPEMRRLPRGGEHDAVLACVITQCILDFYSNDTAREHTARPRLAPETSVAPEHEARS